MYDLSITLFGPPQIKRGKAQITLQRRKDLALLVYLVVTAQPHTRDTLAALLWPDSDQSLARGNVRKNISRLKSDLGSEILLTTNDQVAVNPNLSLWLDVQQFQSHLDQSRKHNHILQNNGQPLCEVCQAVLQDAVQLYRSEFLEGFNLPDSRTFDEWQFFQSEGYRQNLSEALERLVQQYIYLEQYGQAIEHSRKWLSMDELHEPAHRQLMLAYVLSGQQAAALRQFAECSRLLKEELGVEPEQETIELHEAIRVKRISGRGKPTSTKVSRKQASLEETPKAPSSKPRNNLPVTTTPFIGRTQELWKIKDMLLEPSCRVVTLLGPGGSGKTRLSVQIGAILDREMAFKDGVWFIQLAPLTDHNSIVPAILKGLNITTCSGQESPHQQLFNYLRKRQSLLIFDNFEHLLNAESITLVSELAHNAPQVKILITSRERLNIQGENLYQVEGLETPPDDTVLLKPEIDSSQSDYGAIRLFEQSAQRVQPSFTVTRENVKTIAYICRHVQGMPLAIELAAAWIEALSLDEIYKEIKQDLDFLKSELHDAPDRQRSLRVIFDTSWSKLSKPTRSTIKALSVFRSNFSREAAQAITGLSAKTLLELTNKSWIQPQKNSKYQIHELLRQFAYEVLENEPVTFEQIKEKYCNYYSNRLLSLWEISKGAEQSRFYEELEFEYENIKTAWGWLVAKGNHEVVVNNILPALFVYSEIRGKSIEFMKLCERLQEGSQSFSQTEDKNKLEIIVSTAKGSFWTDGHPLRYEFFDGIYPINLGSIQKAWELSQSSIQFHELGFWGSMLAYIYGYLIDANAAIQQLEKTLPQFEEKNSRWELANAKLHLARLLLKPEIDHNKSTNEVIRKHLTDALEIFKSLGDTTNYGQTQRQLGNLSLQEQDLLEAIRQWKTARAQFLSLDANEWVAASSINWQIGDTYIHLGQFDDAYKCFQEISQTNLNHGFIQQAVGALSKESFERARHGNLEDAIRIRRHCLELIKQTGPEYQVAWNHWELGELMRLTGKPDEAAENFEFSYKVFKDFDDNVGLSFYWRGIGDILLSNDETNEAVKCFSKSIEFAHAVHHNWIAAYSSNGLGKAKLARDEIVAAQEHLMTALQLARKVHDPGIALTILECVSELQAKTGNAERAVLLNALVTSHFASWNETKSRATAFSPGLKNRLLPREFNDLMKKGQLLELWDVVDQELIELKKNKASRA